MAPVDARRRPVPALGRGGRAHGRGRARAARPAAPRLGPFAAARARARLRTLHRKRDRAVSVVSVPSTATFDPDAAGYDAMRRRLVPCFDAFYGTALALIDDWRSPGPLRVLDLGAGTGLFAALLLARHPDAEIHLTDASTGMLGEARQRLAGHAAVSFAQADMT